MTNALRQVLTATSAFLLDFDGPVTTLLPAGPNRRLAVATLEPLRAAGVVFPAELADTSDHLAVLRYTATAAPDLVDQVEHIAVDGETVAARSTDLTPGVVDFLTTCRSVGRPVVIVSNNATAPITTYLDRHHLAELIDGIVGRIPGRPELMKPHPELIHRALATLGHPAADCAMIGDSVTDIQVSHTTGVHPIGYAKTPQRGTELAEAGAEATTDNMADLAAAVQLAASLPS